MFGHYLSHKQLMYLIFTLNFLCSEQRVIYFGNCPIVIGGKCDSSEVKFYLYTRSNSKTPEFVLFKEDETDNLTSSAYDSSLANKIIIHGYNSDMYLNVLQNLKDEYLTSNNTNIWMVNYSNLVVSPCYPFSVYNIKYVGRCVASFITRLNATTDQELDIHVIGFSLGGQVPNYVAQYLRPYKLPRITALDPALPLFYTSLINQKLDRTDAEFVHVIHTNALFQGQVYPCGHVDFYVNGGVFQPGCSGIDPFICYHSRAVEYFAESINTKIGFWGWSCDSFVHFVEDKCKPKNPLKLMGEFVDEWSPGVYLVNTANQSPYAMGKDIVNFETHDFRTQRHFSELMNSANWSEYKTVQSNLVSMR